MLKDTVLQIIRKHRGYAATTTDWREEALAEEIAAVVGEEILKAIRAAMVAPL